VRTHSPLFYAHLDMAAGAKAALPDEHRARDLCRRRRGRRGGRASPDWCDAGHGARGPAGFTALEPSAVMLLGGEPLGERFLYWNFVSSSQERIEQAKADWKAGRMKLPDLDNSEFIPLPEEPAPPPNPMS
jgi:redox-sensitive bicupin YhaK (pirin superfamily)